MAHPRVCKQQRWKREHFVQDCWYLAGRMPAVHYGVSWPGVWSVLIQFQRWYWGLRPESVRRLARPFLGKGPKP